MAGFMKRSNLDYNLFCPFHESIGQNSEFHFTHISLFAPKSVCRPNIASREGEKKDRAYHYKIPIYKRMKTVPTSLEIPLSEQTYRYPTGDKAELLSFEKRNKLEILLILK